MERYTAQSFNQSVLIDMSHEVCTELESAASQYFLLKDKLQQVLVRLSRASTSRRQSYMMSLEIQRDTIEGLVCMYGEYIERKMDKLRHIEMVREESEDSNTGDHEDMECQ